ncbi:1051_t:CDS:2 [Gigaspora margarita]|uniref:1051_t:CDS:1 n=1 Tax=Gigaspora margarita TaxID=4874 RepID=A0ABN7UIZ6_GIGMA|nr:1051_t:CDS:2 [Gigaspora margarita]
MGNVLGIKVKVDIGKVVVVGERVVVGKLLGRDIREIAVSGSEVSEKWWYKESNREVIVWEIICQISGCVEEVIVLEGIGCKEGSASSEKF